MLKNAKQDSETLLTYSYSPNPELPALYREQWIDILSFTRPLELANIALTSKFFYNLTRQEITFLRLWHENYMRYLLHNKDNVLEQKKIYNAYKNFCLKFLEIHDPEDSKHQIEIAHLYNFEKTIKIDVDNDKTGKKLKLYENLPQVEETVKQEYQEDLWPTFVSEFFKVVPEKLAYDYIAYIKKNKKIEDEKNIYHTKLGGYINLKYFFESLYVSGKSTALESELAKTANSESFVYKFEYEEKIEKRNERIIKGTRTVSFVGLLISLLFFLVNAVFYYMDMKIPYGDTLFPLNGTLFIISGIWAICGTGLVKHYCLPATADLTDLENKFLAESPTQNAGDEENGFEFQTDYKVEQEDVRYESDPESVAPTSEQNTKYNFLYSFRQRLFSLSARKPEEATRLLSQVVDNAGYTPSRT